MTTPLRKPGPLVLYSRPGCHLCDVAAGILEANGVPFRVQDIEFDLALIRRYGERVPVLYRPADGAELGWPFDEASLENFLGVKKKL